MLKIRILFLVLAGAMALSLIGLREARTESAGPRRVTNTSEEGISINPSISGDGRIVAFESTRDVAGTGGTDHFRAIRANVGVDPATFFQMGGSRAVAPAPSQDGSRIAFASKDDPIGTNADGNSEIFLLDGSKLTQVTNTAPGDVANRVANGNFQPSISDDGRFIAFSSNRDLAGQNSDGNLEIFIYDTLASSFTPLTNSSGIVGSSDAKISGDGVSVAYILDNGATPSAKRDLMEQTRVGLGGPATVLAANVQSLAMTYGRAISDDGTRNVYSAETAINTTQVFLFDCRGGGTTRQITSLGARTTEVPLHPTISGDGTRIAFAARRSVPGAPANSDGGVELYVLDLPSSQVSKITNAPAAATADVVSSLNDDGSVVAFSFPRILSGALANSEMANNSEIYLAGTPPRPPFGALTVVNAASLGKEPSTTKAVAPDSIAVATGIALANSTYQPQKLPNGTFPTNVGGTTVMVNGRAAQIFFVSPGQVNFLVPPQTEIGGADVVITNAENFPSRGSVPTLRSAPGVFTNSGDGSGPAVMLNSDTLQEGPFDPTKGDLRLTIFTTGARNASQNSVVVGGRVLNAEGVIASLDMPGLDEVHVVLPRDLRGAGTVDLFVQSDGRAGNSVSVTFTGDATRDILINEVLADPPDGPAGDANHDGVRDSSDDEFIELVNTTTHDIDISGYQLLSRSSSTTTDTLRHTFAGGTILPACSAVLVFGGGVFALSNPVFGGSLVVKASSGGLSLTNGGGVITLRDSATAILTSLSWGGSTGLSGDANQSMTRSPDVTGSFVLHQAGGNGARSFSPGTQLNGAPFTPCNSFVRIDITPPSAAIDAGAKQQFTAKALNASGSEVPGVIFAWQSSNTGVATIDQNGLATGSKAGSTDINASAHGIQSATATLTVHEVPRVLTRVDVTPQSATVPATGAQQFTAHGIDQFGNEIAGLTFIWESANTGAATIDPTGLATGVARGQSTIKATSQSVNGTATLDVTTPTVLVNEVLADPPNGSDGDANHDGTRDSAQDEFVELVNSTSAPINISGWTMRTHSITSSTETVRHTFAAGTSLSAGEAMLVFGGGTFLTNDPLFGCAQAVKASSGGLSLTNSGLTILVRDGSSNLITQFAYGGTTGLNGGNAQSLTRSPDVNGTFVLHTAIPGARKLSSGLKTDGTPFAYCPGHPATVTISPSSASINVGQTTSFIAQAFDQFGRGMIGVTIVFASDNTSVATVDSISTNPNTGIATVIVSAHNPGTAHITASGADGTTTAHSTQSTLTVSGPSLTINDVSLNEGNSGASTFTFTVSLSTPAPTGGVTFNIATQDGTATTANNDYVARSLTRQTIAAGQAAYTFDVTVNGDASIEPNEIFLVNVTDVSGASIGDGQGVGTIANDDSPSLSLIDISANEGNSGTTTYTFNVTSNLPAPLGGITFDIATADGTATATGGDYVTRNLTAQTIPAGQTSYAFDVTVHGDTLVEPNETFSVNITNVSNAGITDGSGLGTIENDDTAALVISQIYGGGDNSGAALRNDFVEIYNHGNTTVDFSITPYSIQYASVGSNFGTNKTNLSTGTIVPGRYFLVQEAGGATNGVALPMPDATGTLNLSNTAGKVALVAGTTALASATCPGDDGVLPFNPSNAAVADFAGYGNSAPTAGHCYKGTGPASAPSNTTSDFRKAGGCVDNNDNASDFLVAPPNPRNSSSPVGECEPEMTINDLTFTEGNTGSVNATFTVTLSTSTSQAVTVHYATADGTATAPNDYQSTNGLLTFDPGDTTKTITVPVNGDTLDEPSETFFVDLSNATNGVLLDNQAQGTITDNDPAPSLSINDISVAEGDAGTTTATFTVTLSAASGRTVTVDYATADGTAAVASDYQASSTTLIFNPGDTTQPVTVLVNGDTTFEPDETFFVNITSPTNASISDAQGRATIINDDAAPPTPTLSINDVTITEGDSGTSVAIFDVALSPASNQTVTVDFANANGTATVAGNDYQSASGLLTFNPGDTIKPISVTLNGDILVEPVETFFVNLTSATGGAVIGDNQGLGTIQNDDTALLAISQLYGGGGNSGAIFQNDFVEILNRGTTTIDFAVTPYSVQYASSSGTFNSGNKVDLTNGMLAVGQYYLVKLNSGGAVGATFVADLTNTGVNLSASDGKVVLVAGTTVATTISGCPAGVTVADLVGYGSANCSETTATPALSATKSALRKSNGCTDTHSNLADFTTPALSASTPPRNTGSPVHDCNAPPELTFDDVSAMEGNSGTTTLTFILTLAAPAPATVKFDISTQDNTATVADNDYVARSLTGQTIAAGQQTYTFDVTVNGDVNVEPNESFFVNVTNVSGSTIVDSQGVGTIQNDDIPALSINDVSLNEGDSGNTTFSFTVNLSQAAQAGGVTFDIATADGTAAATGGDYVARSVTGQTIPAGQTSYRFDVTVNGDTLVEPNETFNVTITNVSNAFVTDGSGLGTIQNDDTPLVVLSQVYGGGGNSGAQFKNDYVEVFNRGTTSVDLAGWSVQAISDTGTGTWAVTSLCASGHCLLDPGKYFLVKESAGAGATQSLPAPDATGTINLGSTAAKVALVSDATALTGGCPSSNGILDSVGYGTPLVSKEPHMHRRHRTPPQTLESPAAASTRMTMGRTLSCRHRTRATALRLRTIAALGSVPTFASTT